MNFQKKIKLQWILVISVALNVVLCFTLVLTQQQYDQYRKLDPATAYSAALDAVRKSCSESKTDIDCSKLDLGSIRLVIGSRESLQWFMDFEARSGSIKWDDTVIIDTQTNKFVSDSPITFTL